MLFYCGDLHALLLLVISTKCIRKFWIFNTWFYGTPTFSTAITKSLVQNVFIWRHILRSKFQPSTNRNLNRHLVYDLKQYRYHLHSSCNINLTTVSSHPQTHRIAPIIRLYCIFEWIQVYSLQWKTWNCVCGIPTAAIYIIALRFVRVRICVMTRKLSGECFWNLNSIHTRRTNRAFNQL